MDIEQFEELVDRLGESISQWPAPLAEEARVLLTQSQDARNILLEAERLHVLLTDKRVQAPAGLAQRIIANAKQSELFGDGRTPAPTNFPVISANANIQKKTIYERVFSNLKSISYGEWAAMLLPLFFFAGFVMGYFRNEFNTSVPGSNLSEYVAYIVDFSHEFD